MKRIFDAIGVIFLLLCVAVIFDWNAPKDDTDPADGRSGMTLSTDALTGCQYLSYGLFGSSITPRLDGYGFQIGCKDRAEARVELPIE